MLCSFNSVFSLVSSSVRFRCCCILSLTYRLLASWIFIGKLFSLAEFPSGVLDDLFDWNMTIGTIRLVSRLWFCDVGIAKFVGIDGRCSLSGTRIRCCLSSLGFVLGCIFRTPRIMSALCSGWSCEDNSATSQVCIFQKSTRRNRWFGGDWLISIGSCVILLILRARRIRFASGLNNCFRLWVNIVWLVRCCVWLVLFLSGTSWALM